MREVARPRALGERQVERERNCSHSHLPWGIVHYLLVVSMKSKYPGLEESMLQSQSSFFTLVTLSHLSLVTWLVTWRVLTHGGQEGK